MMLMTPYSNYATYGMYYMTDLQGRLSSHLVAGQSYCVTFYVVMASGSGYIVNNIGAYLDNGMIDTAAHCQFPQTEYSPQILDTSIISDTLSWTKIQGNFIANGTETFITLGIFTDTLHTTIIPFTTSPIATYLFDDVSVIASDAVAYAGPTVGIAAGDSTWIGVDSNGDGMPCYWYVLGGTTPIDSGGRIMVRPAATTSYVVVMDLCGVETRDTVVVHVWPLGNVLMWKYANVLIYPNPATNEIMIEGATNSDVIIYDILGSEKLKVNNEQLKTTVDISGLVSGVYFVEIRDEETGERVVKRVVKRD
jgi:hypothetical protein